MFWTLLAHAALVAEGNSNTCHVTHWTGVAVAVSQQSCIRVVSPDDGQVMLETCRDFEPQ
jgi:hypothetical protein